MSHGVRIRAMREADLEAVLRIERASFAVPWTPATFVGLLRRPDAHLFVAEAPSSADGRPIVDGEPAARTSAGRGREGADRADRADRAVARGTPRSGLLSLVGYAAVWVVLDQAELGDIAVDREWRRRGIGQRLLDVVLARMAEIGVRELYLEVRTSNTDAQRLYERNGFVQVGRRRNYYTRPREDALVLRRDLAR